MKSIRRSAVFVALMIMSAAAHAEESSWSGNIGLTSAYVSRGFEQSWGRPALQGGVDYRHVDGWFAGSWVSTVSPHFIESGKLEWDMYAGYASEAGPVGYRAGLYYYRYPGARMSGPGVDYDYGELIVGADWRRWSLSYAVTYTRDYFGFNSATLGVGQDRHSRGSGYVDLSRSFSLPQGFELELHGGYQHVRHFSDYGWHDARIALSRHAGGIDWTLGYAKAWNSAGVYRHYTTGVADRDGNLHVSNPISGTAYISLSKTF